MRRFGFTVVKERLTRPSRSIQSEIIRLFFKISSLGSEERFVGDGKLFRLRLRKVRVPTVPRY